MTKNNKLQVQIILEQAIELELVFSSIQSQFNPFSLPRP